MAKDKRLYMTFPNDFWMHPKIAPLSTEAKWAFVEMNGYSRMQDLDGRIPSVMVARFWSDDVVAELVQSHPDRPVVLWDVDVLVIRDYAQHQQTTADREEVSKMRSKSGKLGAKKRWNSKPMASAMASAMADVKQTDSKPMAETETETTTTDVVVTTPIVSLFDEAYAAWPKRVKRDEAFGRFKDACKKRDPKTLVTDILRFANAYEETTEKQFIPALGPWLFQKRWTDDLPQARSVQRAPSRGEENVAFVTRLAEQESRRGIGS